MINVNEVTNEVEVHIGIIEVNESVLYIVKRFNRLNPDIKTLIAGTACNCGLIESYSQEIDNCFSEDENLQSFVEMIEDKENN